MASPEVELVRAEGIQKSFAGRAVLNIDKLTIRRGESIALLGENGSGKTTLLRILAGLLPPDKLGLMVFDGGGNPYPSGAPMVSYLHQNPHLFAASVRANVEYGLRRLGILAKMRKARADDAMEWAGVFHLADSRADGLSGGERRRVALARIRAVNPRLYLLDEPAAHLDAESINRTAQIIGQLQSENATVITAGHSPFVDGIVVNRRWRLQDGKLKE